MADKKAKKTKPKPKMELEAFDALVVSIGDLSVRIKELSERIDRIVAALSKSKSVKNL